MLFAEYKLLNGKGERKNLLEIFQEEKPIVLRKICGGIFQDKLETFLPEFGRHVLDDAIVDGVPLEVAENVFVPRRRVTEFGIPVVVKNACARRDSSPPFVTLS